MTQTDDRLERALEWIRARDGFVIGSHTDPDGDSLGSSLALALALEQLGKTAVPALAQQAPERLAWLPGAERLVTAPGPPAGSAAAILVECSDFARSGLAGLDVLESLNIDHHAKNSRFADVNWIDVTVAAAGQMIGDLIAALGAELTSDIATLLYVAVLTDTGSFQHSNTDAAALRFAAEMVSAGADPAEIAERVFGGYPASRLRLAAEAFATLQLAENGRVASMAIPAAAFERAGTRDTEELINHAQGIAGVAVSLLLKEGEPGFVRASLRSDGSVNVADIAASHGGGGHPRAAGCQLRGTIDGAREVLLEAVRRGLG